VGGGALALCATHGMASGPGLFAAPGVVGLALGGLVAARGVLATWPALALLALLIGLIALLRPPTLPYTAAPAEPLLEGHDLVMLLLLAAIAFRSALWSAFQVVFHGEWEMLLAMAAAAAAGKLAGGILADRFGIRRWAMLALALSTPLLALGQRQPAVLLAGVALLQSATPACIVAVSRLLPRRPATAAGLTLGLAIAAGGIPALAGAGPFLAAAPALATLSAALAVWWAWREWDGTTSRGERKARPYNDDAVHVG
jgi:FSR family fosmidomycin resistance protein-like MFS transporter